MQGSDIVDRLKAASEADEGIDLALAQALFIEAAETIELLRALMDGSEDLDLELRLPKGSA